MRKSWFQIRWSLRDLRRRWVQVAVIALVIAIGTGVYAGLTSAMDWRGLSYDASYAALSAHDIRVRLAADSYVEEGTLSGALGRMGDPGWVADSEERLIAPAQIEASTPDGTVLVPGRVVGVSVEEDGPNVDCIEVTAGSGFTGRTGAILEKHFADEHEMEERGTLLLAGGVPVVYSGIGLSPEYFMISSGQGDFLAQGSFAVVFMPLPAAQALTGHAGLVNDLVLTLRQGVDVSAAVREVEGAMAAALPVVGVDVETIEDDPAYRIMYRDLDSDRGTVVAMAFLVLVAAAFAAFTLTGRIVEAERREIGIDMALGVPRATIAVRPLLGGAWIALLGVLFGIGIGFLFVALLRSVFTDLLPLPVWLTPLEAGPFLVAAGIGFILPFAASAWPVWRAVRVEPVEAIRTGHLASRGGGFAPLVKRLHLPGRSLIQIPFRNVVRAPRRMVLTATGIGVAMITLVVMAGSIDSFNRILAGAASELESGKVGRMVVTLAGFQPDDSGLVQAIKVMPQVGESEQGLMLGAVASNGGDSLEVRLQVIDMSSDIWHPTVSSRVEAGDLPGIVLSGKAAKDLGLSPGDAVEVEHPYRVGESQFASRTTRMRLVGEHPNPIRFLAYTEIANAGIFGLSGQTNELQVVPADGFSTTDVQRALFSVPGVATVQEPGAAVEMTGEQLESYSGIFRMVEAFALFLAFLIAFNAASIGSDERARENATMMAYGVRVRTLVRMAVQEAAVVGILGSLIGLGLGVLALRWLLARSAATLPELELTASVEPATIAMVLLFGVLVVAIAPVFTTRKLLRTDVPSTLRVME